MSTQGQVPPARAVALIARRELNSKLRSKAFVIGTVVALVAISGVLLLQGAFFGGANQSTIGLSGQATSLGTPLTEAARQLGEEVEIKDVGDPVAGERQVRDGQLDALVSGAPAALHVVVKDDLNPQLGEALNGLVRQQVLSAQLAASESDLDPKEVMATMAAAHIEVTALEPRDAEYGQRLVLGLVIALLLYMSLVMYGQMVAQGVVEEKSSRVVEILLATVRPWQLLAGKVVGLGLVGLIQFALIGVVGLVVATSTGVLTISGSATGTLLWGVVWYLLGYFLYATVFGAAGSLVSRQEDAQSVLTPVLMVIVAGFVIGFNVLINEPTGTTAVTLSLLPPTAPMVMPGRMALGGVPAWQLAVAVTGTLAAIVLLTWLGGKIYNNAVLRSGSRVSLREALAR